MDVGDDWLLPLRPRHVLQTINCALHVFLCPEKAKKRLLPEQPLRKWSEAFGKYKRGRHPPPQNTWNAQFQWAYTYISKNNNTFMHNSNGIPVFSPPGCSLFSSSRRSHSVIIHHNNHAERSPWPLAGLWVVFSYHFCETLYKALPLLPATRFVPTGRNGSSAGNYPLEMFYVFMDFGTSRIQKCHFFVFRKEEKKPANVIKSLPNP